MDDHDEEAVVSTDERRKWPRHSAVEKDVRLFWEEEGKIRICSAQLSDISRGGALVIAPRPLPEGTLTRIGLTRAVGGIDGVVILSSPLAAREFEVRLEFSERCPDAFFRPAVRGIPGTDHRFDS